MAPPRPAPRAALCIDNTYPYYRFFLRNTGAAGATLAVDVLIASKGGGLAPMAFRLRSVGTGGKWFVDDLYIDPFRRG